jgi:hypothetical protein
VIKVFVVGKSPFHTLTLLPRSLLFHVPAEAVSLQPDIFPHFARA